jgi:hypothetical protein
VGGSWCWSDGPGGRTNRGEACETSKIRSFMQASDVFHHLQREHVVSGPPRRRQGPDAVAGRAREFIRATIGVTLPASRRRKPKPPGLARSPPGRRGRLSRAIQFPNVLVGRSESAIVREWVDRKGGVEPEVPEALAGSDGFKVKVMIEGVDHERLSEEPRGPSHRISRPRPRLTRRCRVITIIRPGMYAKEQPVIRLNLTAPVSDRLSAPDTRPRFL